MNIEFSIQQFSINPTINAKIKYIFLSNGIKIGYKMNIIFVATMD